MIPQNPKLIEGLCLARFSAVGDGMHVEVTENNEEGKEKSSNPIFTFRLSEDHVLQIIVHGKEHDLIIPVSELKKAIAYAEIETKSESFYDQEH
jgi:hypothetical protein